MYSATSIRKVAQIPPRVTGAKSLPLFSGKGLLLRQDKLVFSSRRSLFVQTIDALDCARVLSGCLHLGQTSLIDP